MTTDSVATTQKSVAKGSRLGRERLTTWFTTAHDPAETTADLREIKADSVETIHTPVANAWALCACGSTSGTPILRAG
jgi:hypothetical protein